MNTGTEKIAFNRQPAVVSIFYQPQMHRSCLPRLLDNGCSILINSISVNHSACYHIRLSSRRENIMKARAAVAWAPKKPLEIEEVEVMGPREGEVLLKVIASGVCHTDAFTLSGDDPEASFPCILGHEGGCEVVELGAGVKSLEVGDHVIPLYIPECGECEYCRSPKTNLCQSIASTVWTGYMPDGTRRFSKGGKDIFHYMGCSTFSEYTVVPEIALAKINKAAPLDKVCLLGCGVTTGIGAVLNTAKVEAGSNVAVFALGVIGLARTQGGLMAGPVRIIRIDTNRV